MRFSLDSELSVDLACVFGEKWNVQKEDLKTYGETIAKAAQLLDTIRSTGVGPDGGSVYFPRLPYILEEELLMSQSERERFTHLAAVSQEHDVLVSIGIGGSYLGNQALFDVFCGPYWNLKSKKERNGHPQVFFAGQNMDPASLMGTIRQIKREAEQADHRLKVLLLVISKSGTTIEPMAAFRVLKQELSGFCELSYIAITDAEKGNLRAVADKNGWGKFTVPNGIGGRFSIFSQVGLVFAKLIGLDVEEFLRGARFVEEYCRSNDFNNPALMMAAVKFIAMKEYGIVAEVIMPYGEKLRSFGWWYAQLLGESLGKKYDIHGNIVYNGRIPVACVGTTDMHSLTQEHQQGKKNKLVQFISVRYPTDNVNVPCEEDGISGMVKMSRMLNAAAKSNQEALANEGRMSCHICINKLTPFHMGALMYFFFLAIAYEGALADINTYDQPGVEDYKKILHSYLKSYIEKE